MANRSEKKNSKPAYLAKFIPDNFYSKSALWLDCASGDGYMVADYFFKTEGKNGIREGNYVAVDIDPTKLQRLKDEGRKVICIDLEKESIKDHLSKKAAVILSIETLEHLTYETSINVMDDFISVLATGGMMIISFPRNVDLNKPVNKHQPDVEEILCYAKYFESFYKEKWKKSYLIIFRNKK